jgi:hypothetical protein
MNFFDKINLKFLSDAKHAAVKIISQGISNCSMKTFQAVQKVVN